MGFRLHFGHLKKNSTSWYEGVKAAIRWRLESWPHESAVVWAESECCLWYELKASALYIHTRITFFLEYPLFVRVWRTSSDARHYERFIYPARCRSLSDTIFKTIISCIHLLIFVRSSQISSDFERVSQKSQILSNINGAVNSEISILKFFKMVESKKKSGKQKKAFR